MKQCIILCFSLLLMNNVFGQERKLMVNDGHADVILSVNYSPNGQFIASGGRGRSIKIRNANSGKILHILKGHSDDIRSVSYSPNRDFIASASADNTIKIWNAKSGQLLLTLYSFEKGTVFLVTTPSGKYDGNEAGLKYLHYVEDMKVIPLPENDPNFVKGLMGKILKKK